MCPEEQGIVTFDCFERNRKYSHKDTFEYIEGCKRITLNTYEDGLFELWFNQVWKIEVIEIIPMGLNDYKWYRYKIIVNFGEHKRIWTISEFCYKNLLEKCKNYK